MITPNIQHIELLIFHMYYRNFVIYLLPIYTFHICSVTKYKVILENSLNLGALILHFNRNESSANIHWYPAYIPSLPIGFVLFTHG